MIVEQYVGDREGWGQAQQGRLTASRFARGMNGGEKGHVDFKDGMIRVWMRSGAMLDRGLAEKIVETAGFTLTGFDQPRE